jgi:hypothetical protein
MARNCCSHVCTHSRDGGQVSSCKNKSFAFDHWTQRQRRGCSSSTGDLWKAPPCCSAILPMPSAFAMTGAVAGSVLLVSVALANAFTCKLLLRAAVATGATDYEHLALAVGGNRLQVKASRACCSSEEGSPNKRVGNSHGVLFYG